MCGDHSHQPDGIRHESAALRFFAFGGLNNLNCCIHKIAILVDGLRPPQLKVDLLPTLLGKLLKASGPDSYFDFRSRLHAAADSLGNRISMSVGRHVDVFAVLRQPLKDLVRVRKGCAERGRNVHKYLGKFYGRSRMHDAKKKQRALSCQSPLPPPLVQAYSRAL
jgi:hypothetical protein